MNQLYPRRNFQIQHFVMLVFLVLWLMGYGRNCWANKGKMEGILSSKGDSWIEVLDDRDFLHRFIPQWSGEGPANGGAFDRKTIALIDELAVGNRVMVKWVHDDHLRLLDAEILVPKYEEGTFIGYLLKTGKRWIDVQNIEEGKPWRFYLPWVGGYPSEGGGYDRRILRDLENHNPTDPIRFSWKYRSRPTVVSVFEEVVDSITPFWVGKKLPHQNRSGLYQRPRKLSFPMELNNRQSVPLIWLPPKPASPFDMAALNQPVLLIWLPLNQPVLLIWLPPNQPVLLI